MLEPSFKNIITSFLAAKCTLRTIDSLLDIFVAKFSNIQSYFKKSTILEKRKLIGSIEVGGQIIFIHPVAALEKCDPFIPVTLLIEHVAPGIKSAAKPRIIFGCFFKAFFCGRHRTRNFRS